MTTFQTYNLRISEGPVCKTLISPPLVYACHEREDNGYWQEIELMTTFKMLRQTSVPLFTICRRPLTLLWFWAHIAKAFISVFVYFERVSGVVSWYIGRSFCLTFTASRRGIIAQERDPRLIKGLTRIRNNFLGIRDKNINFILCQFQNRNSKHSFCKYNTNLWNWQNEIYVFIPNCYKLYLPYSHLTRSETQVLFLSWDPARFQYLLRWMISLDSVTLTLINIYILYSWLGLHTACVELKSVQYCLLI